jgi:hypothetical protein
MEPELKVIHENGNKVINENGGGQSSGRLSIMNMTFNEEMV